MSKRTRKQGLKSVPSWKAIEIFTFPLPGFPLFPSWFSKLIIEREPLSFYQGEGLGMSSFSQERFVLEKVI